MGWIVFLICCTAVGMAVIKTVRFLFPKKEKDLNLYLEYGKQKVNNEKHYQEYLKWMQKNDPTGVPLDKFRTDEEIEADKKIDSLFNS